VRCSCWGIKSGATCCRWGQGGAIHIPCSNYQATDPAFPAPASECLGGCPLKKMVVRKFILQRGGHGGRGRCEGERGGRHRGGQSTRNTSSTHSHARRLTPSLSCMLLAPRMPPYTHAHTHAHTATHSLAHSHSHSHSHALTHSFTRHPMTMQFSPVQRGNHARVCTTEQAPRLPSGSGPALTTS
jgi:hypothetical protein